MTMRYLQIETEAKSSSPSTWWGRILLWVLAKILPTANPDLALAHEECTTYWLEIDSNGEPQREIGFDNAGRPLVLGPVGDNVGFLIDASDDWSSSTDDSEVAGSSFDRTWSELWPRFKDLQDSG